MRGRSVKLLLVGDVMLGRLVNEVLRERPPTSVWGDTLPTFEAADVRLCNLECAVSDVGEPWLGKAFHFRTDERNVAALQTAAMDLVSLANNHVLDFGPVGLLRTVAVLDEAGIGHAGAGRDQSEAEAPAIRSVGSERIALVAFTDNEPGWAAGPARPGVFYVPTEVEDARAARLLDVVREVRNGVDLLVVSAHWGPNWGTPPPPDHLSLGRALCDAGADVVFGHSCHTVRGVGIHGTSALIYSAGDFVDDYAVDPVERNDWSAMFTVDVAGHSVRRISVEPTVIRDFQARRAAGPDRPLILKRLARLCADLGTPVGVLPGAASLEIVPRAASLS